MRWFLLLLTVPVLGAGLYIYDAAKPRVHPIKQADAARMAARPAERQSHAGQNAPPSAATASNQGLITEWFGKARVVDGDTVQIDGATLHLWAIDAPETDQPCELRGKPWRCGPYATAELEKLIAGRTVACVEEGADSKPHNITASCFVREARCAGAEACETSLGSLNLAMIERGAAMDIEGHFMDSQEDAREQRLGLWAGRFAPPWEWCGAEPGK